MLRNILLFATLALTACHTHHHALNITSEPSAQKYQIEAWDQWGDPISPLYLKKGIATGITPSQIMYPEEVARAEVTLTFPDKEGMFHSQTKVVQFGHPHVDVTSYREPLFGLGIGSTIQTKIAPQTVHFDKR